LPADDLTEHLKRLRVRAGNPSVRVLAKLTERLGPARAMSRSTIQDKISGNNPPRLGQVMALVQACAEYAISIGAPLAEEDTDEQIWRERAQAAQVRTSPPPSPPVDMTAPEPAKQAVKWDLDPLIRAGMHDMVELVETSEGRPMAEWMPQLIEALGLAEMSNEQFLKGASKEKPSEVVESIIALADNAEYSDRDFSAVALDRIMYLCARNQPVKAIPVVIVLLRRKGAPALADQLISLIAGGASRPFPSSVRSDYIPMLFALRAATMGRDAARLLTTLGERGYPSDILEVASSLPDSIPIDRIDILGSVANGSNYHLGSVLKELRKSTLADIDKKKTLDQIISGIPYGKHEEIASFLESQGLREEASRVLERKDEPPF